MKKQSQAGSEAITELINKVQEKLIILEKKIDTLMAFSSPRPTEVKPVTKPFPKQENNYRERIMHKAICADCKKECEVPFKPSGERPVYCKECFSKRKRPAPIKSRFDNRPKVTVPAQAVQTDKPEAAKKKKPAIKKKPVSKKKKK